MKLQLEGVVLLASALLAGCGGGGGNPGTCHGGTEVCAEGQSTTTPPAMTTTGTTGTTGSTGTTGTTTTTSTTGDTMTSGSGSGY